MAPPPLELPLLPPYPPMDAELVEEIPEGDHWQFEPKWDGFRCLVFRDRDQIYLQSRSGKPLARYFPDVVELLRQVKAERFVLDGELVVPVERRLSFEQLQLRLHPAASRVRKLSSEHPAVLVSFDLLVTERRTLLVDKPLTERRKRLEQFMARFVSDRRGLQLSPAETDRAAADRWFQETSGSLDGVMAKRLDAPYDSGGRNAVLKIKQLRTADCVVAGFRYGSNSKRVASLLLGLYDQSGNLHHVGYTSALGAEQAKELTPRLEQLHRRRGGEKGFTGKAPGGPSRWSTERSGQYQALPHELVVEVQYDHVSGDRFRHGTNLLRWRPDKDPRQCQIDQIRRDGGAGKLLQSWK